MARLAILPPDVVLHIVEHYVALCESSQREDDLHRPTRKYLWPLAQTCRYLHDICSNWLFSSYRLLFRVSSIRAKYCPPLLLSPHCPSEADSGERGGLLEWDERVMRDRIAHFASKARYVCELRVEDWGHGEQVPAFPVSAQECLAEVLTSVRHRVKSVRFHGQGPFVGRMCPALWDALRGLGVREMALQGIMPPEVGIERMSCVEKLELEWRGRSAGFLQLVDPTRLELHYMNSHCGLYYDCDDRPPLFKPTSPSLRAITVTYLLPSCDDGVSTGVLFDMTDVPDASFEITFHICCHYKFQMLEIWRDLRRRVKSAFAEGLDCYDVCRSPNYDLVVSRTFSGDDKNVGKNGLLLPVTLEEEGKDLGAVRLQTALL